MEDFDFEISNMLSKEPNKGVFAKFYSKFVKTGQFLENGLPENSFSDSPLFFISSYLRVFRPYRPSYRPTSRKWRKPSLFQPKSFSPSMENIANQFQMIMNRV